MGYIQDMVSEILLKPGRLLGLMLGLYSAQLTAAHEITIGLGDTNRVALSYQNGQFVGSLARLYQCTLDSAGFSYQVQYYPQVRVLHLLDRGEIDIGFPLARLPDRDQYAVFTHPLFETRFHLFTHKNINPDSDLSDYTFTVLRASASAKIAASRNASYEEVASWTQALSLAKLGRFDGALIPAPIVADIGASQLDGLNRIDFGSIQVSIYVSKKTDHHDEIVSKLNAAIKKCVP